MKFITDIFIVIFSFGLLGLFAAAVPLVVVGTLYLFGAPTVLLWIAGIVSFPIGFYLVWKMLD